MNPSQSEPAELRRSVEPALSGAVFCLAASVGYTAANAFQRALVADTYQPLIIGVKESVTVLVVGPVLLWFWFRGRHLWPARRTAWRLVWVGLATQTLGNLNLLFAYGLLGMAVTMPVVMGVNLTCSALFGRVFLGELVTRRTVMALALLIGSIVLISAGAGSGAAHERSLGPSLTASHPVVWTLLGVLAAIVTGMTFAMMATAVRATGVGGTSTAATVFIVTGMGVVSMAPVCLVHLGVEGLAEVPPVNYLVMLGAGVLNLVSFLAITIGLRLTTVARANLLNATQIALSAMAGIIWFNEQLTPSVIFGLCLTIVGMVLIEPNNAPVRPVA